MSPILIIIILIICELFRPALIDGFPLANLNNAVFWMVSTCRLISKSSGPWTKHLGAVPSAPIIIIHSLELFTSVLADGFSQESEWQQVSSSLQDSSQYSGRSQ